jgi:uncharacterized protein YeaO (DUF488 family)
VSTHQVRVKRVYDPPAPADGRRILVDRLWPRGLRRDAAQLDDWLREVAPSDELRRWYGHQSERWPEFDRRYRDELRQPSRDQLVAQLEQQAQRGSLTLLCAAKDAEQSNAAVLRAVLLDRLRQ